MTKIIQDVNIGPNIRKLRKAKGYSQAQMCIKLELIGRPMIRTTYTQIETGARNIFVSDLLAIRDILNVDLNDIFDGLTHINKYDSMDDC